ncbi:MOSC domain-containing protein YiiM [Litoreibacter ponti]|uniref:MOSC domain-containing protein YiiM n=1 Tax=Litoreibacter ponti TaxID=1510457 RepID=A0A2T6BPT2_9RHOB|nr:MOSC domain-containing protein [Litoreibacter ponti]PTX58071.1 MOSC domain-containing protein YiiM [Litoreibacter ponti]
MRTLKDLMALYPHPGRVDWIGVRPARRADMIALDDVEITEAGLEGDRHPSPGKRAVTLIQSEHLPVIAALTGIEVTPEMLRRNLVISGINLTSLRGREIEIGTTRLKITGPCAPCSRMEDTLGHGGYNAMRGHGGMTAEVLRAGRISLGDALTAE